MEVEAKHDTQNIIVHDNSLHVHPRMLNSFSKDVKKNYGSLSAQAQREMWGLY